MRWFKIICINLLVFTVLILVLEIGAGVSRVFLNKDFLTSQLISIEEDFSHPSHPCNEMKTDVLLDHVPNHNGKCIVKGGTVVGEYVKYDESERVKPVLLTLGGSTTSGYYQYISAGNTYPKELADLAQNQYSVLNGGVGGYSSLQELYKFIRDGARIPDLEIVVSLNGVNELPNYHGAEEARKHLFPFLTETQYLMNQNQYWIDQRVTSGLGFKRIQSYMPNLVSLILYIQSSALNPPANATGNKDSLNKTSFSSDDNIYTVVDSVKRWETNVRRINELVRLEGATYYLFLQPTLGLVGVQSNPLKNSPDELLLRKANDRYIAEIRELYAKLKKSCSNLSFCHDISDEILPGVVYNDLRHHNADGNKLLAQVIWRIISAETDKL